MSIIEKAVDKMMGKLDTPVPAKPPGPPGESATEAPPAAPPPVVDESPATDVLMERDHPNESVLSDADAGVPHEDEDGDAPSVPESAESEGSPDESLNLQGTTGQLLDGTAQCLNITF